ncbi:hypothetical protein FOL47_007019 [Perkinsus chesapeaki]|uniref:TLC domain-containing protein n=1 Tax=Perkinsus chesapeaki TaxID=330153 RepID=A0A7J6MWG4_PERCH|nr:hypothetical protein FOL47_007019 [Perkinsus chesapeaki]
MGSSFSAQSPRPSAPSQLTCCVRRSKDGPQSSPAAAAAGWPLGLLVTHKLKHPIVAVDIRQLYQPKGTDPARRVSWELVCGNCDGPTMLYIYHVSWSPSDGTNLSVELVNSGTGLPRPSYLHNVMYFGEPHPSYVCCYIDVDHGNKTETMIRVLDTALLGTEPLCQDLVLGESCLSDAVKGLMAVTDDHIVASLGFDLKVWEKSAHHTPIGSFSAPAGISALTAEAELVYLAFDDIAYSKIDDAEHRTSSILVLGIRQLDVLARIAPHEELLGITRVTSLCRPRCRWRISNDRFESSSSISNGPLFAAGEASGLLRIFEGEAVKGAVIHMNIDGDEIKTVSMAPARDAVDYVGFGPFDNGPLISVSAAAGLTATAWSWGRNLRQLHHHSMLGGSEGGIVDEADVVRRSKVLMDYTHHLILYACRPLPFMLTETGKYIDFGDIQVHEILKDAVEKKVLPGTGVTASEFWTNLEKLLKEFSDENTALLAHRDELQSAIDEWYREGCKEDQEKFLKRIGYLVEPSATKTVVSTRNVDPEMSQLAGPQLVVPVDNARYALNAANARWGSLFDAVYGFDVVPGRPRPGGYDPSRGLAVLEFAFKQLDSILPLVDAKWSDLGYIWVDDRGQLVATTVGGKSTGLKSPSAFVGYRGHAAMGELLFVHNGTHIITKIHKSSQVGKQNSMGLADVVLEAALTAIMDCEDSVAAVDAEDKSRVYSNWAGLMRGNLEASFKKGGKTVTRQLNSDLTFRRAGGEGVLTLTGRVVALVRNVGIHMKTDAVLYRGEEAYEGLVDALVTAAAGLLDLREIGGNSRTGSIYIVKPKLHGPVEVGYACRVFDRVEEMLGLGPKTIKIGVMDEERRTSANLKECIHVARERVVFINTGFLDRTGDEIHTCMHSKSPVAPKGAIKKAGWIHAYEKLNVIEGLSAGMGMRAQIGKGMWAEPDSMKAMLEQKIGHPLAGKIGLSGASTAWVPSPTAATLHALHYHMVDVSAVQKTISTDPTAAEKLRHELLQPPFDASAAKLPKADIQRELDNNAQGILGYVVRWVDLGVGCSKVPDINNVGLMEDRATLRISSQHIANWLLHGIVSEAQVKETLTRMSAVVDQQNKGDAQYTAMKGTGTAFQAALDLVFDGTKSPNGFLRLELPIRLSQRTVEIADPKFALSSSSKLKHLLEKYVDCISEVYHCPLEKPSDVDLFTDVVRKFRTETLKATPRSLSECAASALENAGSDTNFRNMDLVVSRVFLSLIGMRCLASQFLTLSVLSRPESIVDPQCSPGSIAEAAASDVQRLCLQQYGFLGPEARIRVLDGRGAEKNSPHRFMYVTSHLRYILLELLKNAAKSTLDAHLAKINYDFDAALSSDFMQEMPPLGIHIRIEDDDVVMHIRDEGVGLPTSPADTAGMWKFFNAGMTPRSGLDDERCSLFGYGVGLPLSRLYATYFGGSLELFDNLDGVPGCTAKLVLSRRLDTERLAPLSMKVITSPGFIRDSTLDDGTFERRWLLRSEDLSVHRSTKDFITKVDDSLFAATDYTLYCAATAILATGLTVCSTIFFASLCAFARRHTSTLWRATVAMSLTHALGCIIWGGSILLRDEPTVSGASTPEEATLLSASLGYFIVDIFLCTFILKDWESVAHHTFCVVGEIGVLYTGLSGYIIIAFLFIAELSSPFLYAFETGFAPEGSLAALVCQGLFAVLFIGGRLGAGTVMSYYLLRNEDVPFLAKLSCVGLMSISVLWAIRILRIAGQTLASIFSPQKEKLSEAAATASVVAGTAGC